MARIWNSLMLAGAVFTAPPLLAQDQLADGFRDPPEEARPRVWWHWLNGAVSEEGIQRDLEWLQRSGIGGVQIFHGGMPNSSGVVTPPIGYMSPEWKALLRSAVGRAAKMGMEVTVPTSAGWSETGAPFVQPADGMKKYVWTEIEVSGGRRFDGILPRPSDVPGPIGAVEFGENKLLIGDQGPQPPRLYVDSRVIAYRIPLGETRLPLPKVTTARGAVAAEGLFDGKPVKAIEIDRPTRATPAWVRFDYPMPVTVRSVTLVLAGKRPEIGVAGEVPAQLEASEDGTHFRKVTDIVAGAFTQNTSSFAPVTARSFRIVVGPAASGLPPGMEMAPGAMLMPGGPTPDFSKMLTISEMALAGDPRIERFEEKAGFAAVPDFYAVPTPGADPRLVVKRSDVLDLTRRMRADGRLDWTPPTGRWRVVRLGYSLTGHMNGPTTAEATGLEVDKLSAPRVRDFMNRYLREYREALGPDLFGKPGLQATLSDSFEAGHQNWTDDILEQFAKRRGYDPTPWLPVLTGRLVDTAAASDAFLYDFRRTIMDLLAEAHYGTVAQVAKEHGLLSYGEALEAGNRPTLGDDLAMRSHADIPMGAMWTFRREKGPNPAHVADLKGAASAAHLYGRRHVGAESMSSIFQYWAFSPRDLKHVADTEFALGVNRLSIHSSVHQPLIDKAPGLTLWLFGQQFNRNETWAEQARPWIDYLARTSWMLSQGRYAADVAYFYGEEAPIVTLAELGKLGDVPTQYGYDFVNADALTSIVSVQDGAIVTPSGMRYRILQLGGSSSHMTLPTLRRIAELARAGAIVVGDKPSSTPSLADDAAEFKRLADQLWAGGAETRIGAGKVLSAIPVEAALAKIGVEPDQIIVGEAVSPLRLLHRTLDDGHLWFVSNPTGEAIRSEISFRVSGREPELWDAETGTSRPLTYRLEKGRTIVPLALDASGSAIVVFRKPTAVPARTIAPPAERVVATIEGDWSVRFQSGRGAPAGEVQMPAGPWTASEDPGIRYFSGVATYSRTVRAPRARRGARTLLALGDVHDIAEIWVNGRHVRTVWRAPYRADVSDALRPGKNLIEVKVVNRWVNRLVGDAQPGVENVAWTVSPAYSPNARLLPSGLLGPVTLVEQYVR